MSGSEETSQVSVPCPCVRGDSPGSRWRAAFDSVKCRAPAFRDYMDPANLRCAAGHVTRANVDELKALGHGPFRTRLGVAIVPTLLMYSDADLLLLWGKRCGKLGTFGAGKWAFPGGEIKPGESPEEAGARELLEETGLEVNVADVEALPHWQTFIHPDTGERWICVLVTVRIPREQMHLVENREPDKHSEWDWQPRGYLPWASDRFEPSAAQLRDGALDNLDSYAVGAPREPPPIGPNPWEKLLADYCGWLERYDVGLPERDEAEAIRRAMKRGIRSEHEARIVLLAAGSFGDGAADGRDALERVRRYGKLHLDSCKRHS